MSTSYGACLFMVGSLTKVLAVLTVVVMTTLLPFMLTPDEAVQVDNFVRFLVAQRSFVAAPSTSQELDAIPIDELHTITYSGSDERSVDVPFDNGSMSAMVAVPLRFLPEDGEWSLPAQCFDLDGNDPPTDDETTPIRLAKVPEFPYLCDEAGSGKDLFDHVASSLPSVPLSAWGGTSREPPGQAWPR